MRINDLFMILSWHHENMINRHWIIEISAAISVFHPKRRLKYNVRDEEKQKHEENDHFVSKYRAYGKSCRNAICVIGSNVGKRVSNHIQISFCFLRAA